MSHPATNLCILTYPSMHSTYLIATVSDTSDMLPVYSAYHVVPKVGLISRRDSAKAYVRTGKILRSRSSSVVGGSYRAQSGQNTVLFWLVSRPHLSDVKRQGGCFSSSGHKLIFCTTAADDKSCGL